MCVNLAAYLRQTELSLHRADSVNQLNEFLQKRSVHPGFICKIIRRNFHILQNPSMRDWQSILNRKHSIAYIVKLKLKLFFRNTQEVPISVEELRAVLEVLESLEHMLVASVEFDQVKLNELRQKLHACSELMLLRITNPQLSYKIQHVEHLNAASHLITIAIQDLPSWNQLQ